MESIWGFFFRGSSEPQKTQETYSERVDTATFTERLVVAQWADVTGNVPKQQSFGGGGVLGDHTVDGSEIPRPTTWDV